MSPLAEIAKNLPSVSSPLKFYSGKQQRHTLAWVIAVCIWENVIFSPKGASALAGSHLIAYLLILWFLQLTTHGTLHFALFLALLLHCSWLCLNGNHSCKLGFTSFVCLICVIWQWHAFPNKNLSCFLSFFLFFFFFFYHELVQLIMSQFKVFTLFFYHQSPHTTSVCRKWLSATSKISYIQNCIQKQSLILFFIKNE